MKCSHEHAEIEFDDKHACPACDAMAALDGMAEERDAFRADAKAKESEIAASSARLEHLAAENAQLVGELATARVELVEARESIGAMPVDRPTDPEAA